MLSTRIVVRNSRNAGRRSLATGRRRTGIQQHDCATPLVRSQQQQTGIQRLTVASPHEGRNHVIPATWSRSFATSEAKKEEDKQADAKAVEEEAEAPKEKQKEEGDSFRDTINRLKHKDKDEAEKSSSSATASSNEFFHKAAVFFDKFKAEVGEAWKELLQSGERKDINKKIRRPEATAEGEKEYTGPVSIMVIDESEHLTAWERMQRRLTDAPIIQDILTRGEEVYVKSGAKDVKQKVDHLREDAREAWETSQNPWVYRASSVYDTLTAETAESVAVKELRVLDPTFTLEDWRRDVVQYNLPQIMDWFLQGKINQLKPWLGEGVFKRIASEITARKQEGVQIDTHVLGIMNSEILAVEVRYYFCAPFAF
jgi:import inner membrane translocase subunit TIM44